MTPPLVSILINNYNYGNFLAEAIESALTQTYPNVEVIVVDDGSTDNSHEVLAEYRDRIQAVLKPNGGQASAFNAGLEASRGDFLCFLDADDLFQPNKAAAIAQIFTNHPEAEWCFHPLRFQGDNLASATAVPQAGQAGIYDLREPMSRGKLRGYLPIPGTATSGMTFRRSLLSRILPMPEEINITSDDYIKYIALGIAPGYITLEELAIQRIHGNNAYTFRADKRPLRARIHILTAFWIKTNFPELTTFAHGLFASGLSMAWGRKDLDPAVSTIIDKYLDAASLNEEAKIYLRALYYRLKG